MLYPWKYLKISRWYDSSFLSQYSLKMCPFNNDTWNLPNNFEAFEIESGLIKEWFLRLISNLAFNHSRIVLHFSPILALFAFMCLPCLIWRSGTTSPLLPLVSPTPDALQAILQTTICLLIVSQKSTRICISILTRFMNSRTDLLSFTFLFIY